MDPLYGGREVACGVLLFSPTPEKGIYFAIGEGSIIFVACCYTAAPKCVGIRQAPAAYHRPFCEHYDPEDGSELLTSAPRSDCMEQSLVCRSISVEDSESRRFELAFGCFFLTPVVAQHLPRRFFFFFTEHDSLEFCFGRFVLIASGKKILWRVSMKFKVCLQHRVSVVIGLHCCITSWSLCCPITYKMFARKFMSSLS